MLAKIFTWLMLCTICAMSPVYAQNSVTNSQTTSDDSQTISDDEIVLEANVVQIVLNDEHRQGVDWAAIVSDFHTVNLRKEDNPIWLDKKYKLSVGTISTEDYAVLLEALDTVGQMSQYPQPNVKVDLDQPSSARLKLTADDQPQDIRLDLNLSKLKSEYALSFDPHFLLLTSQLKSGQKVPVSMALKAHSETILKNNTTIVIGGLIKEEEITQTHKFPVLGDLPIVGLVFRNQGRLMQKTETVVFLTVRMKADHANS